MRDMLQQLTIPLSAKLTQLLRNAQTARQAFLDAEAQRNQMEADYSQGKITPSRKVEVYGHFYKIQSLDMYHAKELGMALMAEALKIDLK